MADQTMNRRVLLQGIATSSMLGATILPARASPELNAHIDPQVRLLLERHAELLAECDRLERQWKVIWPTLPEWCRSGPKYVDANGRPFGERAGWPATLSNPIRIDRDRWLARPSPHDLRELYEKEQIELSSPAASENYRVRTQKLRKRLKRRREFYEVQRLPTSADWRLIEEKIECVEREILNSLGLDGDADSQECTMILAVNAPTYPKSK